MLSSSRNCAHTQNNITNETTIMIRKQKRFAKLVRLDTQNVDFHDVCLSVSGGAFVVVVVGSTKLESSPKNLTSPACTRRTRRSQMGGSLMTLIEKTRDFFLTKP
jgi:hypothetical protein